MNRFASAVFALALLTGCPPKDTGEGTSAAEPATPPGDGGTAAGGWDSASAEAPTAPADAPTAAAGDTKADKGVMKTVNDAAALLTTGNANNAQRAVSLLEQAVREDPDAAVAYFNLGVAKQQLGDKSGARRYYETAADKDPGLGNAWLYIGFMEEAEGSRDRAIETFRTGVKNDPENMELRTALIAALRKQGKVDEAIREAQAALNINSNSLAVYNNLGLAYLDRNDLDLARFVFEKANASVDGASNNAYIQCNLGWVYYKQGKKGLALGRLQEAVKLDPNLVPALVYLSHLYMDDRNYADVVPLLETAIRKDPNNHGVLVNLGVAYRGVGRLEDAKRANERALQIDPKNPDPYFNLGVLYGDYLKQYDDALNAFNLYLQRGGTQKDLAAEYVKDVEKAKKRAEKKKQQEAKAKEQPAPPPPEQPAPEQPAPAPAPEQPAPEQPAPGEGESPWGGGQ